MSTTWGERGGRLPRRVPAPRGRARLVVLLAIVAGVVGVPSVAADWLAGYQPLAPGSVTRHTGVQRADGSYAVDYRHGAAVRVGRSVVNTGGTAITVTGVGVRMPVPDGYGPWRRVIAHPVGQPGRLLRLPFRLEPGDEVMLVVDVPLTFCRLFPHGVDHVMLTTLPVRWTAPGMERTTYVPLAHRVRIDGPRTCPQR